MNSTISCDGKMILKGDLIIYGKIIFKEPSDVIEKIKPGDKIMIKDDEMYIDTRNKLSRTISSDNRYKTLEFLKEKYKNNNINKKDLRKILDCLKVTYKNDLSFLDMITKLYPIDIPLRTNGIYIDKDFHKNKRYDIPLQKT